MANAACIAAGFPSSVCSQVEQLAQIAQGMQNHPSTAHWAFSNFGRGAKGVKGQSIAIMFEQKEIIGILVVMPFMVMLLLKCIWEAYKRYVDYS